MNKTRVIRDRMRAVNGIRAEANTKLAQQRQLLDMPSNNIDSYEAMKTVVGDFGANATASQT